MEDHTDCIGWIKNEDETWQFCQCKIQLMKKSIGKRYMNCKIETLHLLPHQKNAERIITNPEGSYFLSGDYGHGKTHLMVCQYDYFLSKYRQPVVKFTKEVNLISDWENEFGILLFEICKNIKHLFIDDFGRYTTKETHQNLYFLIDYLYANYIGLTISSNYDFTELIDIYDGAIVRRIENMCEFIKI